MCFRIVKMSFQPAHLAAFLAHFHTHQSQIRQFEGCLYLHILQDSQNPNVIFSYSQWLSPAHLEAYRHSDFFRPVWDYTKTLFDAAPQAWTTHSVAELP